MSFDTADLASMEADGTLVDVITHEMGHVIGIGTIWEDKGLLVGKGTHEPAVHRHQRETRLRSAARQRADASAGREHGRPWHARRPLA